jgi:hypothetical protein
VQLSLDVRDGFSRTPYAGAAMDEHRFFKPLVSFPNLFELVIGQRGVLVVANGNMLNLKSILPVVRH